MFVVCANYPISSIGFQTCMNQTMFHCIQKCVKLVAVPLDSKCPNAHYNSSKISESCYNTFHLKYFGLHMVYEAQRSF